ncbi:MAG: acyl-CoA thioesterase [Candidatus Acidiferrales bacterium]
MNPFHETKLRVRYAETDQWGTVYHSNFFIWFEVGRVELMRSMGFTYKEMEEKDDSHTVVVDVRCIYEKPARYDDVIRVRTWVAESKERTVRFAYEVFNDETGERLARGETLHVICDGQGRPRALPEKYRAHIPITAAGE